MNQEITDNSRACCNCANATMSYPNCSCWQHKYCNGDRPYVIPKEAWIKTAEECEEFEMDTCQEADVYLELHRIMSEESKDKNPKPEPTCKSCGFYENNCPFIRGKLIPYPNKVCKDYIHSAMKEQEQPEVDLEEEIDKEWKKCNPIDEGMGVEMAYVHIEAFDIIARHFYELARQKYEK